jgi:predicted nucleic acid-binding protein
LILTDLKLGTAYLLDTNILSESTKPRPNERCLAFLEQINLDRVFVSVVTLGELRRGVMMVSNPVKRAALLQWLDGSIYTQHGGQMLTVDDGVMRTWASLVIATGKKLSQLPALDSLIAATALHHNLTVATRNTADFQLLGVPSFNPFEETL